MIQEGKEKSNNKIVTSKRPNMLPAKQSSQINEKEFTTQDMLDFVKYYDNKPEKECFDTYEEELNDFLSKHKTKKVIVPTFTIEQIDLILEAIETALAVCDWDNYLKDIYDTPKKQKSDLYKLIYFLNKLKNHIESNNGDNLNIPYIDVNTIMQYIKNMESDDRYEFFQYLNDGYCFTCGNVINKQGDCDYCHEDYIGDEN